jgi:histidyl-tRNA synthetase
MSNPCQPVRGTHDRINDEFIQFDYLKKQCESLVSLYGYHGIETPIFEYATVFKKTLGETSDVVGKEMYSFLDRSGEELTLRPEGTAGVVRACISNGMLHGRLPLKVFYSGPMFRYERPQKGRYRQFNQFGVEALGPMDPFLDAECIAMAAHILKSIGVVTTLNINTLGDQQSRTHHRSLLVEYFNQFKNELSDESQIRLEKNPLRILDSKNKNDQEIVKNAPSIIGSLSADSLQFFNDVQRYLKSFNIPFVINPTIVRGLDYYNHTVFEFVSDELGAQSTVLAGGRYDGLVQKMGGHDVGGIGWAMGMERLLIAMKSKINVMRPISLISIECDDAIIQLSNEMRESGFQCEIIITNSLSKGLKQSTKFDSRFAIIMGEDELKSHSVLFKDLDEKSQSTIRIDDVISHLKISI